MFGLLPLLFALLIAEYSTHAARASVSTYTILDLLIVIGCSVAGWLVVGEFASRLIARQGRRRVLGRWDLVVQAAILGWYAYLCYGLGWAARTHFFSVALFPWLLMQMVHWWTLAPAIRSITGFKWKRFALVLQQLRFGILPMLVILPCFDVGAYFADRWGLEETLFSGAYGALLAIYCAQAFMVVVLIVMPLFLIPMWGAKRMQEEGLVAVMRQACNKMGVGVAGLMRWPIPGGRVYNAAVIGMMSRFRYVLFTDDLMRDLPQEQVMAVLGHELGHARHGHLWLYFLFANAALLLSFQLREPFALILLPWLQAGSRSIGIEFSAAGLQNFAELAGALIIMAIMWRLVFGVISRACERQADLVGAELAGDPLVMCDALKSVARLSGQGENEPSWRHYSIAERVAYLREVHRQPLLATIHHSRIRMLRHLLVLLIIALLLVTFSLLDPSRAANVNDPAATLQEWGQRDRDFASALREADAGNHVPLAQWLNRAEQDDRQTFGYLVIKQIMDAIGTDEDGDPRFDDRPVYRFRHRLRPFFDVSVGNDARGQELERELDNMLAYGLVAGTEQPTEVDIDTARRILPRLEKSVSKYPQHGVYDTIGCVYFVVGDYAKSVTAFEQAMQLFKADKSLVEFSWFATEETKRRAGKIRLHLESLYSRRLEAARSNLAAIQAGKVVNDPTLVPLPRDLGQPSPEPAVPEPTPLPSENVEKGQP